MTRLHRLRGRWLALGLSAASLATPPVAAEVPSWIAGEGDLPLWVSAEVAVTPRGEVRWELLLKAEPSLVRDQLQNARRLRLSGRKPTGSDPCILYTIPPPRSRGPTETPESLEAAAKSAALVLVGTVTDASQGFYRGAPATVFEVAVDRALKVPEGVDARSHVYFVYRDAAIPVGEDYLCVRSKRGQPHLGGSVLLIHDQAPYLAERWLLTPETNELFFTRADGTTSALAPPYVDPDVQFDALTTAVAEALASPKGGQ